MNYLLKYWKTKVYQPINQPKNIYFKFPYAFEAISGVITLADNATTKFAVIRNNSEAPKGLEAPYFSLVMEVESFSDIEVKNHVLAIFQEKDDALIAQSKINRALLRPAFSFAKKALYILFLVFILNVATNLLVGHSGFGVQSGASEQNAQLKRYLAEIAAKHQQLEQQNQQNPQYQQNQNGLQQPPTPILQPQPGEVPANEPAQNLLNSLKDKKNP